MTAGRTLLSVAVGVLALGAIAHAGVYRWVDSSGHVHYGDQPTISSAQGQRLHVTPSNASSSAAQRKHTRAKLKAYRDKQAQTQKQAAQTQQKQQKAQHRCTVLSARLEKAKRVRRVAHRDPQGQVTYLSGADLVAFRQSLQKRVNKACAHTSAQP